MANHQVKHEANTAVGRMVVLANDSNYQIELMENIKKLGLNAVASGLYGLRMNVDDIEEAKKEFEANGCEILMQPMETSIGKNMIVKDVNGVSITVIQHIHKA